MFNLFKKKSKAPSSGLFITNEGEFVDGGTKLSKMSINDLIKELNYNDDQIHTILTFDLEDISNIGVKVFTKDIVFVLANPSVRSISKGDIKKIIKSIDWDFEYSSYMIEEILNSAIDNSSFTSDFMSDVLNMKILYDSIVQVKELGYTLIFNNGILVDFISSDGLNRSAKTIQNLNQELFKNMILEAEKFQSDISDVIFEINEQSTAWASTPKAHSNEYLELHRTNMGNTNFFNLLLAHYNFKCEKGTFILINKGRYIKLDENSYQIGNYIYSFDNDLIYTVKK